jgi:ABC-2 type transport system permease protein
MKTIFLHTIQTALRQKYIQVLAAVLLVLFALVAFNGVIAHKAKLQSFEKARQTVRNAWLNQGPQNPHSSAHYGHYIFQPVTAMQFLDNGIRPFAGSILRLEAHAQNEAAFSPAQDKTELSRFGDMSFAWMLQVLMPLFIILLCFNTVNADKESQNLKLLMAQGVSNSNYLWGKIAALYSIVLTLSATGLLIQLLAYTLFANNAQPVAMGYAIVWLLLYAIYLFVLTTCSVLISAWVKQGRSSLLIQLASWILLMLVLPKITAGVGAAVYPLEHKAVFAKALKEDRAKGIDGHNPEDKRSKQFEDSLFKHYGVDSMSKLPVNSDGLLMQADEEYANIVYDKHFKRIRETIAQQNSISKYLSFLNPYLAIRNTSMNVCQSNFGNHLNLLNEAEQYRRYLIKTLNDKMAYGGSKTGDWDWKVDAKYWETVKDFSYPTASLYQSIQQGTIELAALATWLLLAIIGVTITAKKLKAI